jgi:hypothetical protein
MCFLRLAPEDVVGEKNHKGEPITPGLYHCGEDAYLRLAPKVIERLKRTPMIGDDGLEVVGDDGEPRMTLPEDASVENVGPHSLM